MQVPITALRGVPLGCCSYEYKLNSSHLVYKSQCAHSLEALPPSKTGLL